MLGRMVGEGGCCIPTRGHLGRMPLQVASGGLAEEGLGREVMVCYHVDVGKDSDDGYKGWFMYLSDVY